MTTNQFLKARQEIFLCGFLLRVHEVLHANIICQKVWQKSDSSSRVPKLLNDLCTMQRFDEGTLVWPCRQYAKTDV